MNSLHRTQSSEHLHRDMRVSSESKRVSGTNSTVRSNAHGCLAGFPNQEWPPGVRMLADARQLRPAKGERYRPTDTTWSLLEVRYVVVALPGARGGRALAMLPLPSSPATPSPKKKGKKKKKRRAQTAATDLTSPLFQVQLYQVTIHTYLYLTYTDTRDLPTYP